MSNLSNTEKGKRWEQYVCDYLTSHGYKVIARNFFCRIGEIDIIAFDQSILVFVEVKYRSGLAKGYPQEAITGRKLLNIHMASEVFIRERKLEKYVMRIDVIALWNDAQNVFRFVHYKNVCI